MSDVRLVGRIGGGICMPGKARRGGCGVTRARDRTCVRVAGWTPHRRSRLRQQRSARARCPALAAPPPAALSLRPRLRHALAARAGCGMHAQGAGGGGGGGNVRHDRGALKPPDTRPHTARPLQSSPLQPPSSSGAALRPRSPQPKPRGAGWKVDVAFHGQQVVAVARPHALSVVHHQRRRLVAQHHIQVLDPPLRRVALVDARGGGKGRQRGSAAAATVKSGVQQAAVGGGWHPRGSLPPSPGDGKHAPRR